ncbi:MAG: hypothetical protein R3278_09005, partial [Lysobacter spongiicola]|nr:hypothetical protein [Lysobacter spongiicola]
MDRIPLPGRHRRIPDYNASRDAALLHRRNAGSRIIAGMDEREILSRLIQGPVSGDALAREQGQT